RAPCEPRAASYDLSSLFFDGGLHEARSSQLFSYRSEIESILPLRAIHRDACSAGTAGNRPALRSSLSIHRYVIFKPSSSWMEGSHPRTLFRSVLSLFRPRTPCGFDRSWRLLSVFPAISETRSISS